MNNTLQAITEVLAAIETLKAEVVRLQEEVTGQEERHEASFQHIRSEIVRRTINQLYICEEDAIDTCVDEGRAEITITHELNYEVINQGVEQAIEGAFDELKDDLRNRSVTDEG